MKKVFIILCVLISISWFPTNVKALTLKPTNDAKQGIPYKYTPAEGSVEELYKDIIVTLIQPYITEEISKQYGMLILYDLSSIEFLEIERSEYRTFNFLIKLQVEPFLGAHNTVGLDEITIKIAGDNPKIINFEHIKSFPLPPQLEEYYKDLKL